MITTDNIRVHAFRVTPRGVDPRILNGCLGTFDVSIPGITLFGARLHRARNGSLVALGPQTDPTSARSGGARIDDPELHGHIVEAAVKVAAAFGVNVAEVEQAEIGQGAADTSISEQAAAN